MDVISRSVERDASENGGGLNLREISTDQLVPMMLEQGLNTIGVAAAASAR